MKKIVLLSLSIFLITFTANAAVTPNTNITTTSYVQGAYEVLDSAKQDQFDSTNVTESGEGNFVSSVAASTGAISVTKTEVFVPVGSSGSNSRATIWIQ